MAIDVGVQWKVKGQILIACNCDYGCPCNFNAAPTTGKCEGGWTWIVSEGSHGETPLDGLAFSVYADWPGAIHEGGGVAIAYLDERADAAQREAISALVRGEAGGPWGIFITTYTLEGPHPAPYDVSLAEYETRVKIGDAVELEFEPMRNPVTGAEVHPQILLPEGLLLRHEWLAKSKTFRVRDGVAYDHSGQYTGWADFEYTGP